MKLTFVVQRYGDDFVGGAERYTGSMAKGLAAEGHDVSVVTSCATSYEDWADVYPEGASTEHGVTVHRLRVRTPRANERFIPLHLRAVDTADIPLWPWAQERWAQTMGPDMAGVEPVLAELASSNDVTVLVGYHYAQTLRLTEVAAVHGPTVVVPTAHPEGAFHVGRVRRMFEHADRVLCLAPEEADLVADLHGVRDRIDVVPCPVEPFDPPEPSVVDAVLAAHGLEQGRYATVVGRVDPAKGSDDAVRFAKLFRRSVDPGFRLALIGPGGDLAADDALVPTGFVEEQEKNALVAGAAAVVQPSYMESFSLALMEGWLLGRPALIQARSRVLAGHAERSGGGLTYEDYLGFEAALATLLRRPELASRLGERGRAYVRTEFAWERVAPAFLDVMERAAAAGGRRLATDRIGAP